MSEEHWDKEAIYDEKISPLMTQIIALCKEHKIPMVMQFQIGNHEEDGPFFCTTSLPFEGVACDKIKELSRIVQPSRPVVLAETIATDAVGRTHITIRRMQ